MTNGTLSLMAFRNGAKYGSPGVVTESTTPAETSVLPTTRPSPGKCLAEVATLAPAMPFRNADPWLETVAGLWPYSRWSAPMGWFCDSVPGGTTSITGAKFMFTPAAESSRAHSVASARRLEGLIVPWTTALGIVENPGPRSAWISPPSWFAATKNRTWPVDRAVAWFWTSSATARTAAEPSVVVAMNHTEPKWWVRIA